MVRSRASSVVALALAAACGAPLARAAVYSYAYSQSATPAVGLGAVDATGGSVRSFSASYDAAAKRLGFSVAFGPATGQSWLSTRGFWMVMDNGPAPVSRANELSIFYFDASTLANPRLTVYTYDGSGTNRSYTSGDLIIGGFERDRVYSLGVTDTYPPSGPQRLMSFDIDASSIMSHTPLHAGARPWAGTGFGAQLGLWLYPVQGYSATYADARGGIGTIAYSLPGWFSLTNASTVPSDTPAPGAAAVLALGGACAARRRRPSA